MRRLREDDITAVETIMRAAYGIDRPYAARIRSYLHRRGTLPLVAEHDARVAGAVFGHGYTTSAYVALMGVDPALHRRGTAHALMTALIAWCDERGFRDVRLDATPAGAPLYERFGFTDFGTTIVFSRDRVVESTPSARVVPAQASDAATIVRIDTDAFGADRSPLLEQLLAEHDALVATNGRGYIVMQWSNPSRLIGPWIAQDPNAARDLLHTALGRAGDQPALYVPSVNQAAVDLATAAGFVPRRRLRHMIRGAGTMPSPAVFGRASLGDG